MKKHRPLVSRLLVPAVRPFRRLDDASAFGTAWAAISRSLRKCSAARSPPTALWTGATSPRSAGGAAADAVPDYDLPALPARVLVLASSVPLSPSRPSSWRPGLTCDVTTDADAVDVGHAAIVAYDPTGDRGDAVAPGRAPIARSSARTHSAAFLP